MKKIINSSIHELAIMEKSSIGYVLSLKEKACSAKLLQLLDSYVRIYLHHVKATSFMKKVSDKNSFKTIETFVQEQQSFIDGYIGGDMKRELVLTTSFRKLLYMQLGYYYSMLSLLPGSSADIDQIIQVIDKKENMVQELDTLEQYFIIPQVAKYENT